MIILILAFADGTPDFRDFRVTTNPTILDAFLKDLESVQARLVLSQDYRGATTPKGGPIKGSGSVGGLPGSKKSSALMTKALTTFTVVGAFCLNWPF